VRQGRARSSVGFGGTGGGCLGAVGMTEVLHLAIGSISQVSFRALSALCRWCVARSPSS
jgi:hypothetical protein